MAGQRADEGVEDVPRAAERDRAVLLRRGCRRRGASPASAVSGRSLGDRELEIGERDDAVAQERLLARLVDEAELAEAPEQKRKGGSTLPIVPVVVRYLLKSTEMVAGAVPVMVSMTLRSPNCGFLKTISRTPSRMATLASGVSPAFSPSIQTSAHGAALMLARPRGSSAMRVTSPGWISTVSVPT